MKDLQLTSLKQQAIQTALTGDWQNAILYNKMLLADNPDDIDALNRLALAFTVLGKIKNAKATYKKVFDIDPLNPIAIKSLKKLKETTGDAVSPTFCINNIFLEETGKTKIVELVNVAQPKMIQKLGAGQLIELSIKRSKIFVLEGKQYLGVLPDDIAKRLIKLIKSGNKYEAFIKSADPHKVLVFIKEVKRSTRFKHQPSFIAQADANLLEKNTKIKNYKIREKEEKEEEEAENQEEEAE